MIQANIASNRSTSDGPSIMRTVALIVLLAAVCFIAGCSTTTQTVTEDAFDELDGHIKAHKYTPFRPPRDGDGVGTMISYNRLGQESTMAAASEFLPTNAVTPNTFRAGALKTSYRINKQGGITLGLAKVFEGLLDLDGALTHTNVMAINVTLDHPFEQRITWLSARRHLNTLPTNSLVFTAARIPGSLVLHHVFGVRGIHYEFIGTNGSSLKITADIADVIKLTPELRRRFEGKSSMDFSNTLLVGYRAWGGRELVALLPTATTPPEVTPAAAEQARSAAVPPPERTYSKQQIIERTNVSDSIAEQLRPAVLKYLGKHALTLAIDKMYPMHLYYDPGQQSRISDNFEVFTRDRRAQMFFVNVRPEDRGRVNATIMADKPVQGLLGGRDRPRSGEFGHGDTVMILKKSPDDRENGNYVARLSFPGGRPEFFKRNPNAMLVIRLLD